MKNYEFIIYGLFADAWRVDVKVDLADYLEKRMSDIDSKELNNSLDSLERAHRSIAADLQRESLFMLETSSYECEKVAFNNRKTLIKGREENLVIENVNTINRLFSEKVISVIW